MNKEIWYHNVSLRHSVFRIMCILRRSFFVYLRKNRYTTLLPKCFENKVSIFVELTKN